MPRERQQPRQPIRAQTINQGVEARDLIDDITGYGGIQTTTGKNGVALTYTGPLVGLEVGVASGAITAASGTTPGTGNVVIYQLPYSGAGVSSITIPVKNWIPAAIADTKHVIIGKAHGVWIVIFAEFTCP